MPHSSEPASKKVYETPKLLLFGNVQELTKSNPTGAAHLDADGMPCKTG